MQNPGGYSPAPEQGEAAGGFPRRDNRQKVLQRTMMQTYSGKGVSRVPID
jgi:hypothetical protein